MCLDVSSPNQTQARLRCDHAKCVTKMLRCEWHLSPDLKPLGSASINLCVTRLYACTCINCLLICKGLPETGIVWCCTTDKAVELPPEQI